MKYSEYSSDQNAALDQAEHEAFDPSTESLIANRSTTKRMAVAM